MREGNLRLRCVVVALAFAPLALTACESSQEESARLEKAAKAHAARDARAVRGVTRPSAEVKVTGTDLLQSSEGAAAVVLLENRSSAPLRNLPIELTARDAQGAVVYTNRAPGLAASLVTGPLLGGHAALAWVDDQVQASSKPASVSARVGEGERVSGSTPSLTVRAHVAEGNTTGGEVEGQLLNDSATEEHEVVVYCVARRGARIVAAGRAVIPQAPAHSATRFELFPIGEVRGAQLELTTAASTRG